MGNHENKAYAVSQQIAKESTSFRYVIILRVFVFLVIASTIFWVWHKISDPDNFPIKNVQIVATYRHINPQELQQVISNAIEGNFFKLKVRKLQDEVLQIPWVYAVAVKRDWPGKVIVKITEQTAVARWDDNSLLNGDGDIFTPPQSTLPDSLPQLIGDNSQVDNILFMYNKLRTIFAQRGLYITKLQLTNDYSWNVTLSNGIKVYLGQIQELQRSERFVKVYNNIIGGNADNVVNVDLRYQHGLAIKWKKDVANGS